MTVQKLTSDSQNNTTNIYTQIKTNLPKLYHTFNLATKCLVMCKLYPDAGGIK